MVITVKCFCFYFPVSLSIFYTSNIDVLVKFTNIGSVIYYLIL